MPEQPTIAELFAQWRHAKNTGQSLTLEELCREFPERIDEFRAYLWAEQFGHPFPDEEATTDINSGPDAVDPEITHTHTTANRQSALNLFPKLPGYVIDQELGRGGMGVVYRAYDVQLQRLVAIKMVLHGVVAGGVARQRFVTEAKAMATIKHPNVAQIYASGDHQGVPYFVMEYCAGGSLLAQLKETPIAPAAAAELCIALARGLHAAHQHGVLHRDLKPDNVLLSADGIPKITDFGLAKRLDEFGSKDDGPTQSGAAIGTPSYMAPEQARGDTKHATVATDVYGLGAVLYRILTGRPPFVGTTTLATSIGARLRHTLDRESDAYKQLYAQRTMAERINSQAEALGITHPKLRRGRAIANRNTLTYVLINLRALMRIRNAAQEARRAADQGTLPA